MSLRNISFYIIGFLLSTIFTIVLIEICFRFLPVNEGLRAQPVNDKTPIFKFEANRTATFSKNWNFDIINEVRVNNAGFVNNNNYDEKSETRLLSIIGDSYVEALMVPFDKSLTGILSKKAKKNRVYSFAASGAGLSQHLIWAEHARKKYKSDFFIFVIISNDFSESLSKYGSSPGFHRFKINHEDEWTMLLSNYEPSILRKIFRKSKLAMYLITNLKIHSIFDIQLNLGKSDNRKKFVSNFDAEVSSEFWNDSLKATNIYLNNIEKFAGVDKDRILFVLDGVRPELYQENGMETVRNSFWVKMRNKFIYEARLKGYDVIDMQEKFSANFKKEGKKFEFKSDSHWSDIGHALVAKSIKESYYWKRFLE